MTPNYDRAARMAYKTLLDLHIDTFPVEPLDILKRCKNTVVHTYDELMPLYGVSDRVYFKDQELEGLEAITVRKQIGEKTVYELFYYSHGNPQRRRFTLAHELGHIILKHSAEEDWEEKEADYFASQLLAPSPVLDLYGAAADAEFIARTFGLSKAASRIAANRHTREATETERAIMQQFLHCVAT